MACVPETVQEGCVVTSDGPDPLVSSPGRRFQGRVYTHLTQRRVCRRVHRCLVQNSGMCAHTTPVSSVGGGRDNPPWSGDQSLTWDHKQPGDGLEMSTLPAEVQTDLVPVFGPRAPLCSPPRLLRRPLAPGYSVPITTPQSLTATCSSEHPRLALLPSVWGALLWPFSSGLSFEASPSRALP